MSPISAKVLASVYDDRFFTSSTCHAGPQSEAQVLEGIAAVHRNFPNAEVVPSSMDAWTKAILANVSALSLPVVTDAEPGSTWVQGVASDPNKIRRYRAVARTAANAVADGRVDTNDPRYVAFQDLLLKEPEHTWGVASGCEGDYTDKQVGQFPVS